jgi:replication fork clamp-binding protein CrfC
MTQSIATPSAERVSLYDLDLDLWLEIAIAQLKAGDFNNLDVENLIEELEGLSGSHKREVETRLKRLIEHILKRCYVDMPDCFRGWEVTIINQRDELKKLLRQSPSLKRHFMHSFDDSFATALEIVRVEYDTDFPDTWRFSRDLDMVLSAKFWESQNY